LNLDQELALACRQLGLLALQPSLRTGDGHPLAGAHADQVALELSDHGEHVE
jgi:hypothetical protein